MYGTNKRKLTIAIDYDDTISLVPNFFKNMIENWKHAIDFYIVTYRDKNAYNDELREFEELVGHKVIFTSTKAKIDHFQADIWIDDTPMAIVADMNSTGYKISGSQMEFMERKVCRVIDGVTSCHNLISIKDNKDFKFCPYCGNSLAFHSY